MPPLPFAPRPLAGEGLSSWVARLAAHNFVTPADFWADLGSDDVADLALHDDLLERLSARTRLSVAELRRSFAPDRAATAAPLAVNQPGAIRGAACAACCRAAADEAGGSVAKIAIEIDGVALSGFANRFTALIDACSLASTLKRNLS